MPAARLRTSAGRALAGRRRGAAVPLLRAVTTAVITVAPSTSTPASGEFGAHDQLGHHAVADAQSHVVGARLAAFGQQVDAPARGLAPGHLGQQLLVLGLLLGRQLLADQRAHVGQDAVARLAALRFGQVAQLGKARPLRGDDRVHLRRLRRRQAELVDQPLAEVAQRPAGRRLGRRGLARPRCRRGRRGARLGRALATRRRRPPCSRRRRRRARGGVAVADGRAPRRRRKHAAAAACACSLT